MRVYLTGLELEKDDPNRMRVPLRDSFQARSVETVYLRSNWLEGRDRFLVDLVYRRGVPISQLAHLMQIRPNSLRRRLRTLVKRLHNPEYLFCLANREKFSAREREILRRHFVQGLTILQTARRCECSRHMVYRTLEKVKERITLCRRLTKPSLRKAEQQGPPGSVIRLESARRPLREAQ